MRKATLLAMAAAIVAMFAVPGTASANWTKHHVNATENIELEITTTDFFQEGEFGGDTCSSLISKVDFEVGTTGTVTTFEPETQATTITQNCQGIGLLANCDVHEAKADNLPWTIHTATPDTVTITTGTFTTTLTGGFNCPHTPSYTPGTLTWTVAAGETNTTSTATLTGTLKGDGPAQNVTIKGTMHVLGTITYGI